MKRPDFVTEENLARWNKNIENDPNMPKEVLSIDIIKEVCYAGLWLAEELDKLGCERDHITSIQFNAGRYAFGRDPWAAHQHVLELYKKKLDESARAD